MLLADVRSYLRQHKQVTLLQLTTHFDMSDEAMQLLLRQWIQGGYLQKQRQSCGTNSSNCGHCSAIQNETYLWMPNQQVIHFYTKKVDFP